MSDREIRRLCAELELTADDLKRLNIYESLLKRWSKMMNLVSPSTLDDIWLRHFIDSAQVQRGRPRAQTWCDLGSGAGFPGLVTAILLANNPLSQVHLVESDQRKCAFLRDVSRETGLRTTVHPERIEKVIPQLEGIDAVSARALAPLGQLLDWSEELLIKGAVGVFLKGKDVELELTRLTDPSRFDISLSGSLSHPSGILVTARMNVDPEPIRDSTKHEGSGSR